MGVSVAVHSLLKRLERGQLNGPVKLSVIFISLHAISAKKCAREGEEIVYEIFKKDILPYTLPHKRPRFWGVVAGQGSPYGMLAHIS